MQSTSGQEERKSSTDDDEREWQEWLKFVRSGGGQKDSSLLGQQLPSEYNPSDLKSLSLDYVHSLAGVAFTRLPHKQQVQLLAITQKRFDMWLKKQRLPINKPPASPNKGSPTAVGNRRHLSVPPASIPPPSSEFMRAMEVENFLVDKANSGKCGIEKGSVWSSNLPPIDLSRFRSGSSSVGENNGEVPADYSDEEVFVEEQGKSSTDNVTTRFSKAGRNV